MGMKSISALILLSSDVSGHATVLSFGTESRTTRPREPQVVFRGDRGPTTNTGNRCVQKNMDYADKRVADWCKNSDLWSASGSYKGLKEASTTVDEGYCLGSIPGTFMNTEYQGQLTGVPRQYMGDKKTQSYCPGDKITVWTGVSAFHYGTHFIDMVPQSAEQIRGMRHCPNGANVDWISSDRMRNYPLPCYDPNANPVPAASGHLKGAIRLSAPISLRNDKEGGSEYRDLKGNRIFGDFSGQQFMVKTQFELPHEVKFEAGPIIFRWLWFCGVDVCNGERQAWGMGELFHACIDARISPTCGAPPAPTTQAPETTTSAPEVTTPRPKPTLPNWWPTEKPEQPTEEPTEEPSENPTENPCQPPATTTEAPATTTEATTTEAPATTEAPETTTARPRPTLPDRPTTEAPSFGECRKLKHASSIAANSAWCNANCYNSMGGLMYTMCCDAADESTCDANMHCYCPPEGTTTMGPTTEAPVTPE